MKIWGYVTGTIAAVLVASWCFVSLLAGYGFLTGDMPPSVDVEGLFKFVTLSVVYFLVWGGGFAAGKEVGDA